MSKQELKQKGFTIIEVVLVLAIAALIFLMVFIALPALQRNQRDTARKQELGKVISAVTTYQSNNRGKSPTSSAADLQAFAKYLDGTYGTNLSIKDKNGQSQTVTGIQLTTTVVVVGSGVTTGNASASNDEIYLSTGSGCDQAGANFATPSSTRQAAAIVILENGSASYCQAS